MKLLKVGSSPSCDIVLNNEYVSSYHADITVLDSGEIFVEDKGSKNGTYIGVSKKRIEPGQEYAVHRGDRIMFGNEPLRWEKVPQANSFNKPRRIVNIGSNQRNDLVIPGNAVSRYHATFLINKDGKPMIVDNGSTNGTKVNGQKIPANRPTLIKKGDNVIVGEEDITTRLEDYMPSGGGAGKVIGIIGGIAAAVALIVCAVIFLWPKGELPDTAVVMVRNVYHYNMELSDNPYKVPIKIESPAFAIMGTGFFIDEEGRIATNRHVANPWLEEYQDQDAYTKLKIEDLLKQIWDEQMNEIPRYISSREELPYLVSTNIGEQIYDAWIQKTDGRLSTLNSMLDRIHKTPVKVTGESDAITIAFANQHYTMFTQFEPAVMVAVSDTKDKDVAILQLNTKKTPKDILEEGILDINNVNLTKPVKQKEQLSFKGYPDGLVRTWDEKFNSSTNIPTTYTAPVSRHKDPNHFELQGNITGGFSGAPVYYDGKIYGVVSSYHSAGDDVIVETARALKELYDKEVKPYRE